MINADSASRQTIHAQCLQDGLCDGLARLGAKAAYPAFGVVTGKRCQVHQADGFAQPRRLIFLFHTAPAGQRTGAPFDGRGVGLHSHHPIKIQRHAIITWRMDLR